MVIFRSIERALQAGVFVATDGGRIANMSRLRDFFTISLYLMVCLASLMMGLAEGGWMLPTLLTLPVATAAFFVVGNIQPPSARPIISEARHTIR